MNWEQQAVITCREKGIEVVGFEGGLVFVKGECDEVFAVLEETVAKWISE